MFTYQGGSVVEIGDSVLLEHGRTPGVVVTIVVSAEEMKATNVEVPGVMLKSPPFGFVYLSHEYLSEDPMLLVARAPKA